MTWLTAKKKFKFKISWPCRDHIHVVVALRVLIWILRFIDALGTRVCINALMLDILNLFIL